MGFGIGGFVCFYFFCVVFVLFLCVGWGFFSCFCCCWLFVFGDFYFVVVGGVHVLVSVPNTWIALNASDLSFL